ncbi:MAG: hypothetical protein F6K00_21800 [Leptolyngbya sp. SIOISBB]|nr:hypothetical protein [Leptolyngbya sp. SIOISBB]
MGYCSLDGSIAAASYALLVLATIPAMPALASPGIQTPNERSLSRNDSALNHWMGSSSDDRGESA